MEVVGRSSRYHTNGGSWQEFQLPYQRRQQVGALATRPMEVVGRSSSYHTKGGRRQEFQLPDQGKQQVGVLATRPMEVEGRSSSYQTKASRFKMLRVYRKFQRLFFQMLAYLIFFGVILNFMKLQKTLRPFFFAIGVLIFEENTNLKLYFFTILTHFKRTRPREVVGRSSSYQTNGGSRQEFQLPDQWRQQVGVLATRPMEVVGRSSSYLPFDSNSPDIHLSIST